MSFKKVGERIEEGILLLIILLNIFDFMHVLSPTLDYVKKIISWVALGYLLYKASLSNVVFGYKHKRFDAIIVLVMFLFIFNKLGSYAVATQLSIDHKLDDYLIFDTPVSLTGEEKQAIGHQLTLGHETRSFVIDEKIVSVTTHSVIYPFINSIVKYLYYIELITFHIAALLLLIIAYSCACLFHIRKPSLLHVIHEEGPIRKTRDVFFRTISIFLVLSAFFVVFFNLVMEWLALIIDAPFIVIAFFFYLLVWIKHHKRFHVESFIYKIGNAGDSFYEHFVSLFHTRRGIYMAVSGLLVLHLITDLASFIIPYVFSTHSLYLSQLGDGHTSLFALFMSQISTPLESAGLGIMYVLNTVAITLLLFTPARIWYKLYTHHSELFDWRFIVVFFVSLAAFVMSPLFKITQISAVGLVGLDIQTQTISATLPMMLGLVLFLLLSYLFSIHYTRIASIIVVIASVGFLASYVILFFLDYIQYLVVTLTTLTFPLIFMYFILFILITIGFYLGGVYFFIHSIFNYKKLT